MITIRSSSTDSLRCIGQRLIISIESHDLLSWLARRSNELVLGCSDCEGLVLVVQHTRTTTLVRLDLSTLGPGVLATASNLEGDGRLHGVWPFSH